MTIEPASPEPPKRDLAAQIRVGSLAFLGVCVVIAWVVAGNYDPSKSAPAKKDGPARTVATESAPLDDDTPSPTPTESAPLDDDTPLPTPTETAPINVGTPALPTSTNPAPASAPPTSTNPAPTPSGPAGSTPGSSRNNPVPAGMQVGVGDGLLLAILTSIRPADAIVSANDPFALPPGPNQEYLQVEVRLTCDKPSDDTCFFSTFELKAVGADGFVNDAEIFILGIDDLLEDGEYLGGFTITGKVFFMIPRNDPTLILYHEDFLIEDITYFALP